MPADSGGRANACQSFPKENTRNRLTVSISLQQAFIEKTTAPLSPWWNTLWILWLIFFPTHFFGVGCILRYSLKHTPFVSLQTKYNWIYLCQETIYYGLYLIQFQMSFRGRNKLTYVFTGCCIYFIDCQSDKKLGDHPERSITLHPTAPTLGRFALSVGRL